MTQYVTNPELKWSKFGEVVNCCNKHESAVFGNCSTHPKYSWTDAQSLGTFAIYSPLNTLVFVMFHNHYWYDLSLQNHLNNKNIFIAFPLSCKEFLNGNMVPYYNEISKPLQACFNDITWLFPRQMKELYIANWNMRDHYTKLVPVTNNWYHIRDTILNLQNNNQTNKLQ